MGEVGDMFEKAKNFVEEKTGMDVDPMLDQVKGLIPGLGGEAPPDATHSSAGATKSPEISEPSEEDAVAETASEA